ncbi:MAG TPA: class I SAM-dependent methyltransferase [Rhizomicrobium sp.]|nr:class I SAM-dependent methyltransferase [Rhizomicrobium sp.]
MSASGQVKRFARQFAALPGRAWRFVSDPAYRSVVALALRRPGNLFQPYGTTGEDRYPVVFAAARSALAGSAPLRLLSFGCATGEEVATLSRYFPGAFVKGLDINPRSIAACRARFAGVADCAFAVADTAAGEPAGTYDAVFCMAVLRHGDLAGANAQRCDHLIRFADFERTVADFARCLKVGGLLALRHSNFRFADTAAAASFELLLEAPRLASPASVGTPQYGPDNRRLPDAPLEGVLFRKRA